MLNQMRRGMHFGALRQGYVQLQMKWHVMPLEACAQEDIFPSLACACESDCKFIAHPLHTQGVLAEHEGEMHMHDVNRASLEDANAPHSPCGASMRVPRNEAKSSLDDDTEEDLDSDDTLFCFQRRVSAHPKQVL